MYLALHEDLSLLQIYQLINHLLVHQSTIKFLLVQTLVFLVLILESFIILYCIFQFFLLKKFPLLNFDKYYLPKEDLIIIFLFTYLLVFFSIYWHFFKYFSLFLLFLVKQFFHFHPNQHIMSYLH